MSNSIYICTGHKHSFIVTKRDQWLTYTSSNGYGVAFSETLTGLYFTLPRIIHMESMEWGVDSKNFRWNPWNGGWTPYFFKMDSMEWGMDSMNWGMDSRLFKDGMGDGFHIFFIPFSQVHT